MLLGTFLLAIQSSMSGPIPLTHTMPVFREILLLARRENAASDPIERKAAA